MGPLPSVASEGPGGGVKKNTRETSLYRLATVAAEGAGGGGVGAEAGMNTPSGAISFNMTLSMSGSVEGFLRQVEQQSLTAPSGEGGGARMQEEQEEAAARRDASSSSSSSHLPLHPSTSPNLPFHPSFSPHLPLHPSSSPHLPLYPAPSSHLPETAPRRRDAAVAMRLPGGGHPLDWNRSRDADPLLRDTGAAAGGIEWRG